MLFQSFSFTFDGSSLYINQFNRNCLDLYPGVRAMTDRDYTSWGKVAAIIPIYLCPHGEQRSIKRDSIVL